MPKEDHNPPKPTFWSFGCRFGADERAALGQILKALHTLIGQVNHMAGELADLQAAVAAESAGVDSAVALLNGLAAKIDALIAGGSDPAALAALSTEIKAKTQALADAVVADARP